MHPLRARHLLLRFALTSLVAFVIVGIPLAALYSRQLDSRAEAAARQHAQYVTTSLLRQELTPADLSAPVLPGTERYTQLLTLVRTRILRVQYPVVRVKIWARDGTVLFSDEPRLVGTRFPPESDLREAFSGQVASDISDLGAPENEFERSLAPQLFETYVPLSFEAGGQPAAVVEFYTDLQAAHEQVGRSFRVLGVALLAGLFIIYVLQLPIVRRVARTLTAQNRELHELLGKEHATVARLKELNRMQADFVATVSHELRTPLTSIVGYAKTLRRPEFAGDEPARTEFVQAIERQSERLSGLVDNLLAASRLQDRNGDASASLSFAEAASAAVSSLDARPGRIRLDVPGDLPMVRTDPHLLELILVNLLGNALKFSPGSESCELGARTDAETFRFWVKDRGIGIRPEEQARVFDRFYQVDASSTRSFGGVGLGLSLVRESVLSLGGAIHLQSEPGKGTTVEVTLPLGSSRESHPSEPGLQPLPPAIPIRSGPVGRNSGQG